MGVDSNVMEEFTDLFIQAIDANYGEEREKSVSSLQRFFVDNEISFMDIDKSEFNDDFVQQKIVIAFLEKYLDGAEKHFDPLNKFFDSMHKMAVERGSSGSACFASLTQFSDNIPILRDGSTPNDQASILPDINLIRAILENDHRWGNTLRKWSEQGHLDQDKYEILPVDNESKTLHACFDVVSHEGNVDHRQGLKHEVGDVSYEVFGGELSNDVSDREPVDDSVTIEGVRTEYSEINEEATSDADKSTVAPTIIVNGPVNGHININLGHSQIVNAGDTNGSAVMGDDNVVHAQSKKEATTQPAEKKQVKTVDGQKKLEPPKKDDLASPVVETPERQIVDADNRDILSADDPRRQTESKKSSWFNRVAATTALCVAGAATYLIPTHWDDITGLVSNDDAAPTYQMADAVNASSIDQRFKAVLERDNGFNKADLCIVNAVIEKVDAPNAQVWSTSLNSSNFNEQYDTVIQPMYNDIIRGCANQSGGHDSLSQNEVHKVGSAIHADIRSKLGMF